MGSMFRSEDMHLLKIVMSKDNEYPIVDILGKRGFAHMLDMNADQQIFKLPYIDLVKRCEESERKVSFIIDQCNSYKIPMTPCSSVEELSVLTRDIAQHRQMVSHSRLCVS